jgi:hypothetical protein
MGMADATGPEDPGNDGQWVGLADAQAASVRSSAGKERASRKDMGGMLDALLGLSRASSRTPRGTWYFP